MASAFEEDIPDFINKIKATTGKEPEHFISHSWGGVHLMAYLAKNEGANFKIYGLFWQQKRYKSKKSQKVFDSRFIVVWLLYIPC